MSKQLLILLGAAIIAIAGAYFFHLNLTGRRPADVVAAIAPPADPDADSVLVARSELRIGQRVKADSFEWKSFPKNAVSGRFITKKQKPDATTSLIGMVANAEIGAGDPIVLSRLTQIGEGGVLAALITPGMRAVSIPITPTQAAGGLVQPGDRVDIVVSRDIEVVSRSDNATRSEPSASIVIENVKVIAIDQNLGGEGSPPSVGGQAATLELTPAQVDVLQKADRVGDLSLVVRSLADAQATPNGAPVARLTQISRRVGATTQSGDNVIVYRAGTPNVESGTR